MMRTIHKSEISQLYEMIQETIDASYRVCYPSEAVQFFKNYHSITNVDKRRRIGELLIIEDQDEIVATGSLVKNEISGVFVLQSKQKMGLGRQIMLELEARARKNGVSEISLDISLPARKFYESLNYQISELYKLDVGKGQSLGYWRGKKKLN